MQYEQELNKISKLINLEIKFRNNDNLFYWNQVIENLIYIPVQYTQEEIEYDKQYLIDNNYEIIEISLILLNNNKAIGILPLSINKELGKSCNIKSFRTDIVEPLFIKNINIKIIKKINKKILTLIKNLSTKINLKKLTYLHKFNGNKNISLSNWRIETMKLIAESKIKTELLIDLSLDINEIKNNFRESYKNLLKKNYSEITIKILDSENYFIWNEFKKLHLAVAGKQTRSEESWSKQYDNIKNNKALLIYIKDFEEKIIGCGYFRITRDECEYSVAVYDRSLFHLPLGHFVQLAIVEELKKRGLKWYKIGVLSNKYENPAPSEKEINISQFKEGFASNFFPQYIIVQHLKDE
jgi:FemAB family protein